MVRLNRIYTKTGDKGETRLVGGQKVPKDDLRIETFGTIDELLASLGLVRTALESPDAPPAASDLHAFVVRVQNELFNLGSDLATLLADRHPKQPVIESRHIEALEQQIDTWNEALPELRSFILPGGGWVASHLHVARTVCRRAERLLTRLIREQEDQVSPLALPYVNRLSDALFVACRHASRVYGHTEPLWTPETT